MEVVGDSDPGYASLKALVSASTEQYTAVVPQCKQFLDARQIVFCRRATLLRPISSIPSLAVAFQPLVGDPGNVNAMVVLQLHNLTSCAMLVASSVAQLGALAEEQQEQSSHRDWVRPSSVAHILPPRSSRNVLLSSGEAAGMRGSILWQTIPERRGGEIALDQEQ